MFRRKKSNHTLEDFKVLNYNNYMAGIDYLFNCSDKVKKYNQ